jgi:aspartate kinase
VAATLFRELADRGINVDMIVQNSGADGKTDISFTVGKTDLDAAMVACEKVRTAIGAASVTSDDAIGRVSVIGAGMKSSPGVTALMFETLSQRGINIEMISTSSIRISCVVRADRVNEAVQALHTAFGLDATS